LDPAGVEASDCREHWQEFSISADETMVDIDADTVLVAVVINVVTASLREGFAYLCHESNVLYEH
jgi:hypothetical protein